MNYEEDKEIEDAASAAAQSILKALVSKEKSQDIKSKIFSEIDLEKAADFTTKEEIIVGFYKALLTNDQVALKALGEGVAADGGVLVPDEFRAELIRDLEEPTSLRSLVRVVPQKRDVMTIPKLGSRPKLRWTGESSVKSILKKMLHLSVMVSCKFRKLRETLKDIFETIRSQTLRREGSETVIGKSLLGLWDSPDLQATVRVQEKS